MGNSADVNVLADGRISGGSGTLPTDATSSWSTVLAAGFTDLGYLSEDGIVQSIGQDTKEIKAADGSTVRKVQTSHTLEYKVKLLQTDPDTLAAYYGEDNVDDTTNTVEIKSQTNQRQSWVLDVIDGANIIRIVIPDGEVTAHGDVLFKNDEAIAYDLTITCYADTDGVKAYEYFDTPGIS